MPHLLSTIKISNFKSIIDHEFELASYTPLIGYNNAGKTNVLSAIKWLLRKSSLAADCFNNVAQPVSIEGKITGIDDLILEQLPANQRGAISAFIENGELWIKRIQLIPSDSTTNIRLHVKEPGENGQWRTNPNGIDNALNALFPDPIHLKAVDNSEEDVSKVKSSSTIGKLLSEILGPVEEQYGEQVAQCLQGVKDIFHVDGQNRAPELAEFDRAVNEKIDTFFPNVKVKVHLPAPELKEVFSRGTIKVFEPHSEAARDVGSLGNGAQRSIQMALIQHLAEIKRGVDNNGTTTLLLIDEPELYLHPQAIEVVRCALKLLSTEGYQIVFSTHSSLMLSHEDIANAVLVRKDERVGTYRRVTLKSAIPQVENDAMSQLRLMFSLANSPNILFSEKIILTEGQTENRVLPQLFEKITGKTLGLCKYAMVQQGGVDSTKKSMMVLSVMDMPTKAIVDLDYILKNGVRNGYLDHDDPDLLACQQHLLAIAVERGFGIGGDNWPRGNQQFSAANAFSILAAEPDISDNLQELHSKMLAKNIWFWRKGAIEDHLGLESKNEQAWARFVDRLKREPFEDVVPDHEFVIDCINWILN